MHSHQPESQGASDWHRALAASCAQDGVPLLLSSCPDNTTVHICQHCAHKAKGEQMFTSIAHHGTHFHPEQVCDMQTLRLRGILEWRDEVTSGPDHSGSSTSSEVMILIWPAGEFKRLPRGMTASEIVHDQVRWHICATSSNIGVLFVASFPPFYTVFQKIVNVEQATYSLCIA